MSLRKLVSLLLLLAVVPLGAQAHGKTTAVEYYRYTDREGQVVISRQGVPNDLIGNGYEVLNENGRVIRRIPRAPTPQELEQRRLQEQQAREDRRLLRLYTLADDVERARDSKLAEVDTLINVYQTDIFELTARRKELLGRAANLERGGREVPHDLLDSISSIEREEADLLHRMAVAEQEKEAIRQEFSRERERLLFLLQNK